MRNTCEPKQIPSWLASVRHHPTPDFLSHIHPQYGDVAKVWLAIPANAPVEQVVLRTIPNGEQHFCGMQKQFVKNGLDWWEAEILATEKLMPYRFGLQTEEQIWWLNALGISRAIPLEMFDFKMLVGEPEIEWLNQSIFYQIFPDRFYNADPANDPSGDADPYRHFRRETYPWGEPSGQKQGVIPFYGGDLLGIEQKLDYLQELGVNAIYLNPVFRAYTNHRYDVADYKEVDPILGGDQALISLSRALKARQMHYVLDIVPNHCGFGHAWFQQALKQPQSSQREFFFFDQDSEKYVSWMGFGSLPKLNYQSQVLRREMYEDQDSIFSYWLKPPFLSDGWRVDVANMLGRQDQLQFSEEVLRGIRQAVKRTNPQAYLFGENFYDPTSQLQGNAWDGVMNYSGFCTPLLHWLHTYAETALGWKGTMASQSRLDTDSLVETWTSHLAVIPWKIALQQLNLLDSHDTSRLRTQLGGNDTLARLAAVVQFTFPGVPCLYYGDEIGLENEPEFHSRSCFPWDPARWDQDLLQFYRNLIRLRKEQEVLAKGSFSMLYWDDHMVAFERSLGGRSVIVTANRDDLVTDSILLERPLTLNTSAEILTGFFTGRQMRLSPSGLEIPQLPQGAEIWL